MNHKLTCAEAFVLSQAAAWSAVGCLTSAFQIQLIAPQEIACIYAAVSLVSILLLSRRRGGWLLLAADAAAGWVLWHWRLVQDSLLSLLAVLARVYDGGYGWGIPQALQAVSARPDMALALVGAGIVQCVCLSVCRRSGTFPAVAAMMVPLLACLVVTDTVPDSRWFFLLLTCLALLLLTDNVRIESGGQGSKLALAAVIPVVLALGLLFHLTPQESYVNNTASIRSSLMASIQQMPDRLQSDGLAMPSFVRPREQVGLSTLSSQPQLGLLVAEVTAENGQTVYLRVRDYDTYTGSAWVSEDDRQETLVGTGESLGSVMVQELNSQGGRLTPCYPNGELILEGGRVRNSDGETIHRVDCMLSAMGARPGGEWQQLPEATLQAAAQLARELGADASDAAAAADIIGAYVSSCAVYDRNPSVMTDESEDFALWFLTEAERGYCVHFATSAAVLMRSIGIPARYVTGYKVNTVPGETTRVTSDDAHAWVEYYDQKTWTWNVLEATPGTVELAPAEENQPETQAMQQSSPETSAETAVPVLPSEQEVTEPEQPVPRQIPVRWLLVPVGMAAVWALAECQRRVRLHIRRRKLRRGDINSRAMGRWKELQLLTRLSGCRMPEELTALAEKAVYSQHLLEKEELGRFAGFAAHCRKLLREKPMWKKLLYRYWYAVI